MRISTAISIVLLLLSFGCNSERTTADDARDALVENQAKWATYKGQITSYHLSTTYYYVGTPVSVDLVVSTADDSITSCTKTVYRSTQTTSDCLSETYFHHTIEYYFAYASELINSGQITTYSFNPSNGTPISAYGQPQDPGLMDAGTPGFTIEFTN